MSVAADMKQDGPIINDMADSIGKSIQTLAGVTQNGFSSTGFYVGFLLLIILVVGLYVSFETS